MKPFNEMTRDELLSLREKLVQQYEDKKKLGLVLNMARGKPSAAQLDDSMELLDVMDGRSDMLASDGTDIRNYGCLEGLPECVRKHPMVQA
jgi:hypothetical protein